MRTSSLAFALVLLAAACNKPAPKPEVRSDPGQAPPEALQRAAPAVSAVLLFPEKAADKAPEFYKARFKTTKGDFVIEVRRDWAPRGADRFYNLVKAGYFDDVAFFRAIDGFMVQLGIHGSPQVNAKWHAAVIQDDPAGVQSNRRGFVTFATAGPDTRTTQIFISYADNSKLDSMGFSPFGKVVQGMDTLDGLYKGYGEGQPRGMGPDQGRLQAEGNAYLKKDYPLLDYVQTARLEP